MAFAKKSLKTVLWQFFGCILSMADEWVVGLRYVANGKRNVTVSDCCLINTKGPVAEGLFQA
ncbi:hypothetical protein RvVAT039_23210 [Agrobacterium vitis]|nr:hypothetical protein RvVAT039_23210 [Agrobacterium vitis]